MIGRIIKGVGGLYQLWAQDTRWPCKARGRFRKEGEKPAVGDEAAFTPAGEGEDYGVIERILPRKNLLTRPCVANVDQLLVVLALTQPEPDLLLADKLLLQARLAGVEAIPVLNKADLGDDAALRTQYLLSGYAPVTVCAHTGQGIEALRARMRGHMCVYAGQSGVGKSSLLNALLGVACMPTGDVSRIERGRHTTRHVELLALGEETWLVDTPGFSLLELALLDPELLKEHYPEYTPYQENCRFLGCNHINEPGCAVKDAVARGALSRPRHERYAQIFAQLQEKWSNRFD